MSEDAAGTAPNRRDVVRAMAALSLAPLGDPARGIPAALPAPSRADGSPLQVRGSLETLEIAPILLAARDFYPEGAAVRGGGIGNLVGAPRVTALGDAGPADVATHAETQALRYSVARPDLRIILTVTEALYRIVARRSAGIASLADLKGKRVATLATTSAGFFLARMLGQVGLGYQDLIPVRVATHGMAEALYRREVDAVAIWEPHAGNAVRMLAADAVAFAGDGVYRELFNLNSTAANLADPRLRPRIVRFVRSVVAASEAMRRAPAAAQRLVAATGNFAIDEVERSWPTLNFAAHLPDDLLDILVAEEGWLAAQDGRPPRDRERLSSLIDPTILAAARAA